MNLHSASRYSDVTTSRYIINGLPVLERFLLLEACGPRPFASNGSMSVMVDKRSSGRSRE